MPYQRFYFYESLVIKDISSVPKRQLLKPLCFSLVSGIIKHCSRELIEIYNVLLSECKAPTLQERAMIEDYQVLSAQEGMKG